MANRKVVFRTNPCPLCKERVTTNGLGRKSHMRACYAKRWRAAVAAFGGLQVGDTLRCPDAWPGLRDKTLRIVRIRPDYATAVELGGSDDECCRYSIGAEWLSSAVRVQLATCAGCGEAHELTRYHAKYHRGGGDVVDYCAGCAIEVRAGPHDYISALQLEPVQAAYTNAQHPRSWVMCPDCEASFQLRAGEALPAHSFNRVPCAMSGQQCER